jgi:hypothetical protein
MDTTFVENGLCSCAGNGTCASCCFCLGRNTTDGRKALCEKISRFLVLQPIYQSALASAMHEFFPDKVVHDDEQDICRMLFEALLFEDHHAGMTPISYFLDHAPLSADEKRLYQAWRDRTRYEPLVVEKVTPGKELQLADTAGTTRYRVYESKGSTTIKEGTVIIARLVPFLDGWMITTEVVLSYAGPTLRDQLQEAYGMTLRQLTFVRRHHAEHKRRMGA